jgi:ketosteroid isomerase-like protein
MRNRILLFTAALLLLVAGCSSNDPTTSDEYTALEQELAQTNQALVEAGTQLAEVTTERDALIAEGAESARADLPAGAAEALASYNDAVLAADGDAMLGYVTDEFTFLSYGTDVQEREFRADWVNTYYGSFKLETIGDQMVVGGGDTYIVCEPERVTTPALAEGFSVIRLVESNGAWLVDVHRFVGE